MIAFVGESGIGKTQSALYCAAHTKAVVVRPIIAKESALVSLILEKMDLYDRETGKYGTGRKDMSVQDRILLASDYLKRTARPLIVDEAGSLGDGQLTMLRKLADVSGAVVVLIGETDQHTRRCDDLLVKLGGIYNLQRRCEVVKAETMDDQDAVALARDSGIDLAAEMSEYIATVCKTPAIASRLLSKINQDAKITVSVIDQILKDMPK
jgi:DNA transposition AAA+ family ATPase